MNAPSKSKAHLRDRESETADKEKQEELVAITLTLQCIFQEGEMKVPNTRNLKLRGIMTTKPLNSLTFLLLL